MGFIVTNLGVSSRVVVLFYNKRTAEQWIKEGKQAVKLTRLRAPGARGDDAAECNEA